MVPYFTLTDVIRLSALILIGFAAASSLTMTAQGADLQASPAPIPETRLDTPSGLPVPRFVSLKSDETFCRTGPTFAHPVRITYKRRGMPALVVAETRDHWRKIRDPDGDECWIHRTKLSGAKTIIIVEEGLVVRARPNDGASQKARLGRGVIARVEKSGNSWVKISAPGVRGWVRKTGYWGPSASNGI